MKKAKLFFILFVLIIIIFSEPTFCQKNISESKNLIEYNYFNLNDSVKTSSIIYYNSKFYSSIKTGLIAGAIGAAVTLGAFYLHTTGQNSCDMGCAMVATGAPIVVGAISFIAGTTIKYLTMDKSESEITHYPYPRRPFTQIGISTSLYPSLNTPDYDMVKLGLVYRNKNRSYYLPNKISLLYGGGQGGVYNSFYVYSSNLSVEALNINYDNLFGWIYGVELGVSFADATNESRYMQHDEISGKYEYILTDSSSVKKTAPFIDFVGGFNINLFSWLSFEMALKIEPYGLNNVFNNSSSFFRYKVGGTIGIYF